MYQIKLNIVIKYKDAIHLEYFYLPCYKVPEVGTSSFIVGYEDDGVVRVPVSRGPGTYGNVQATYTSKDVTAKSGLDYLPANGILALGSGMDMAYINVTILDDTEREFAEQFELTLTGVSGKHHIHIWILLNILKN